MTFEVAAVLAYTLNCVVGDDIPIPTLLELTNNPFGFIDTDPLNT
jgi:hypothetical protein